MNPLKLLVSFAPWIVFRLVSAFPFDEPLFGTKVALVAAAVLCVYQARSSTKGVLFWGTAAFFSLSLFFVALMSNQWVASRLGLLSQVALGSIVWCSILLRRPFTIDYAKSFVPREYWTHPLFLRRNIVISGAWGVYFLVGIAVSLARMHFPGTSPVFLHGVDIAAMTAVILFTSYSSRRSE